MSMEPAAELSCQELVELVTEYLEEALPAGDVARFDVHLEGCPGCGYYFESIRATVRITGQVPALALPDNVKSELLAAFRGWKRG